MSNTTAIVFLDKVKKLKIEKIKLPKKGVVYYLEIENTANQDLHKLPGLTKSNFDKIIELVNDLENV